MIFQSQFPISQTSSFTPVSGRLLQRKCACGKETAGGGECAECQGKKRLVQRHGLGGNVLSAAPLLVESALRSPGESLDTGARATMELAFGYDFSNVRIHRGGAATAAAEAVDAAAFTIGRDIVFSERHYEPQTPCGQWLLAHELAHTIQQRAVAGSMPPGSFQITAHDDPSEAEADSAAARVMMGSLIGGEAAAGLSPTAPALAKTNCSSLTYKTCKGQRCGYGGSGVCGWGGIALGCRCMGAQSPPASKVLEVLIIIGLSVALLLTVIAALADPEPATKLGLIGLSAAQIALLLSLLGYEEDGTSASEGTASTIGGDASAVNPQNVA